MSAIVQVWELSANPIYDDTIYYHGGPHAKETTAKTPSSSFRRRQPQYLRDESIRWFVIALLCFALLAAISAWPLLQTLKALVSP